MTEAFSKMNGWRKYWTSEHKISSNDPQVNVARTRNQKAIDEIDWKLTLGGIDRIIPSRKFGKSLDLCGGNGLFLPLLASKSFEVTIVDINTELLNQINGADYPLLKKVNGDALNFLKTSETKFDIIFCYAGIQYFENREVVELFTLIFDRLNYGGILFMGDIPDLEKRSKFLKKSKKVDQYFKSLATELPIIGNWFTKDWIILLAQWSGFSNIKVIKQKKRLIYSDFRFDLIAERNS
jgi:ubiquinone/menaquinone biosynthesis C-methylase UbiE